MVLTDSLEPRVVPRPEHAISRQAINENALKVLYRLHRYGHKAHLVGGSVRDLLLGRTPKDFDVGTDARPNQIRRIFRNSRIIGRRFRLVQVYYPDGVVEVSTFRREPGPQEKAAAPDDLLITDDNVFGTPREDAFRRDFTVNALFYDISDFSVIDYVGGIPDLERRLIRCIGDPDLRFREDPVRMMRACELAGRLAFAIEGSTQEGIHRHRRDLERAATARVVEELLQLLRCGQAGTALQWMLDLGLLEVLLPEAYAMVAAGERGLGDFGRLLPAIDRLVATGRQLSDTALFATLLLPQMLLRRFDIEAIDRRSLGRAALEELAAETVDPFFGRFQLSAQRAEWVRNALLIFHRLGATAWRPGERERFTHRASFDDALLLFELMVIATGEGRDELAQWLELRKRGASREAADESPGDAQAARRRRRRPRRRRRGAPDS